MYQLDLLHQRRRWLVQQSGSQPSPRYLLLDNHDVRVRN
jgi:3',5'-cyclic AMP phosphodiesterase CpdA